MKTLTNQKTNLLSARSTRLMNVAFVAAAVAYGLPTHAQTLQLNQAYTAQPTSPGLWLKNPGYIGLRGDGFYGIYGNGGAGYGIGVIGNNNYDGTAIEGDAVSGTGGLFTCISGYGIHTYSKGTLPTLFVENQAGGPSALFRGNVNFMPGSTLELGFGVPGKEISAGKIGYGTFTNGALDIVGAGTTNSNRRVKIWAEGGTTFTGSITANGVYNASDARYKQNIATIDNALDTIVALHGVTFSWNRNAWKEQNFPGGRQVGFIAQEVEKVLPGLVTTDNNGYKAVAYASVVPVLVESVKALKGQIEDLKSENATIKARLTDMGTFKAQLATLTTRLSRLEEKAVRQ